MYLQIWLCIYKECVVYNGALIGEYIHCFVFLQSFITGHRYFHPPPSLPNPISMSMYLGRYGGVRIPNAGIRGEAAIKLYISSLYIYNFLLVKKVKIISRLSHNVSFTSSGSLYILFLYLSNFNWHYNISRIILNSIPLFRWL